MKNIKLIAIIIILIVANLYVLITVSFEIKYRALIDDYEKLSVEYHELYDKYIAQEEQLQEVMAANNKKSLSIKDYVAKLFKLKNITSYVIEFQNIIDKAIEPIIK